MHKEPCREKSKGLEPISDWYYRLFQTIPDSLLVTRLRDGQIRDMNPRFLETMGYSREELIGRTPLQVGFWVYPEDRESLKKLLLENRGHCSGFETTMRNKAGREYPVMLSARVVEIEGEQYIISESREDSERRAIRKALQESESRFREMVEMLPVIVYEADSAGRLTFANQAAFQDFGYTQEEFDRGLAVLDMVSAEDRPRALKNFGLILNGEKTRDAEYRMLKRDGTGFNALISSTPILRNEKSVGLRGVITDITDLRKAKEELSRSEEKYRTVVEMSNDAVTMVKGNRHIYVNPKMVEIFGYERPDEIVGHPIFQMIHPDDRKRVLDINLRRQEGEPVPDKYVFKGIRKDGQRIFLETSAKRLVYRGESVSLVFLRDITERVQADSALRESEERARFIVNTVPHSISITRVDDGRYVLVNDYFSHLTGFSREETVGRTVFDLKVFVNVRDRERFIREMREKGELTNFEIQYRKKDGTLFTTLLSGRPIRYDGEDCLVVVGTDITKRKRMEEALQKSEEKYRLLVENANEAILVLQEGLIQFINPKAVQIMDYRKHNLSPQPFSKFIHPEDREQVMGHYFKRMGGEPASPGYSFRLLDDQGNVFWVEINAVPISWEGQPAGLVFLTDINEKKQLEQQFLQAQKMEAVGRLAGGVAHDFNNLLTSILGHSDLMLMRLRPGDPLVGDIKEILKAANRATDLTRQLLAFSRKQVMQPRILNLNAIIVDMKKMLKRLIGEDIILETLLSPTLGQVLVDPGQIDQVIMNLVVNARDALPKGGTLTIETSNTLLDEFQVRSYIGAKSGAYVLLSVKDTGSGMTEELQSHIFEPFFTTKEMGKGTGLGLSTVYGIVKQSNGYIWVDSRPGQGTAFKIFLPQQEGAAESDLKLDRGKVSLRGEETILLAEDNELVRGLTRSVLEHFGYRVLETEDGEEAGRMSKGYEGPIHLLLTDVVMPGIGGRALAEQLQISRPGINILFMSGYSEEAILLQGMQTLGGHFLQKPFTPEELGQRVREILDSV